MKKMSKNEAKIHERIGRELTKRIPQRTRLKRELIVQVLGEEEYEQASEILKYQTFSQVFFKVSLIKDSNPAYHTVILHLIVDWEKFLEAYRKGCDGLFYSTKKLVDGSTLKEALEWIKRPKLEFSPALKLNYMKKTFDCPDYVLEELISYGEKTRKKGFEEECLYKNKKV